MGLSFAQRLILAEEEATYATDPVLVAADAKLVRNLRILPLEGEYRDRDLMTGQLGTQPERLVNAHAAVQFDIEAGGASAAGVAPTWGDFMLACGYAETVTALTSVEYTLVSTGYGSAAVRAHIGGADGHGQLILGCRGTIGFSMVAGQEPLFQCELRGKFAAPAKEAAPVTDFSAHVAPPVAEPPNVTAFTIGGDALCVQSLSVTGGHQVRVNRYANCESVQLGGRRRYTGRAVVRMPALDAKDLIAEAKAGELQALALTIGATAGNILSLAAPKVQLKFQGYQDADGDLDVNLDLNFTPDAGDDELAWTLT